MKSNTSSDKVCLEPKSSYFKGRSVMEWIGVNKAIYENSLTEIRRFKSTGYLDTVII